MKKHLLLPSLFLTVLSHGQNNYRPIPEIEATWIQAAFLYSAYNGHEHATVTSVVYTEYDTVFNGHSYRRFGSHAIADWMDGFGSQQNQNSGTDNVPYTHGYFRQDTVAKQVFLWNNLSQTDELLYDFGNLVVGQPYPQTVTNINYPNLLVMAADSVQLQDGNYYKRWVLGTNASDSAYVSVIEGVGGTNGFNIPILPVFEQSSNLLCHKTGAQGVFENWVTGIISPRYSENCSNTLSIASTDETVAIGIYPNPANGFFTIESDRTLHSITLFNLNGQLLFTQENIVGNNTMSIDPGTIENGAYLLAIRLSDDTVVTKQIQFFR